eukprot:JZ548268.1.p2 GENE.JZ548268.1~~JZ548268.1.p2  ORF type:complete len:113 (+),score=40.43 JZ548268.1:3-341(+)
MAKLLVTTGKANPKRPVKGGITMLHAAEARGAEVPELVSFLMEHGVEPNVQDAQGLTPLHMACLHGHMQTARLYVEHGTLMDLRTKDGFTAVELAVMKGYDVSALSEAAAKR